MAPLLGSLANMVGDNPALMDTLKYVLHPLYDNPVPGVCKHALWLVHASIHVSALAAAFSSRIYFWDHSWEGHGLCFGS